MEHSQEEWERQKETIRRLYLDEDYTVKVVIDTMAREYGFRAMYGFPLQLLVFFIRFLLCFGIE